MSSPNLPPSIFSLSNANRFRFWCVVNVLRAWCFANAFPLVYSQLSGFRLDTLSLLGPRAKQSTQCEPTDDICFASNAGVPVYRVAAICGGCVHFSVLIVALGSVPMIAGLRNFGHWRQSMRTVTLLISLHFGTSIVYFSLSSLPPSPDPYWIFPLRNLEWLFSVPLIVTVLGNLCCAAESFVNPDVSNRQATIAVNGEISTDRDTTATGATDDDEKQAERDAFLSSGSLASADVNNPVLQYAADSAVYHANAIAMGVLGCFGPLTLTPLGNILTCFATISLIIGWILLKNLLFAVAKQQSTSSADSSTSSMVWFLNFTPVYLGVFWVLFGVVRVGRLFYELVYLDKGLYGSGASKLLLEGEVPDHCMVEEVLFTIFDAVVKAQTAHLFQEVSVVKLTIFLALSHQAELKLRSSTDQFLRFVFHEIRVPFNALILSLEVLKSDSLSGDSAKQDPNTKEHFEIATTASHSMMRIMNDVLSLQRIASGKLVLCQEPVNPASVASIVCKSHVYEAEVKKVRVKYEAIEGEGCGGNLLLMIDEVRFSQVCNNLISNAIKFAKKDVQVKVEMRPAVAGDIGMDGDGGGGGGEGRVFVRVMVIDDGAGISKENKAFLFKQFSQIKARELQNSGGSGMGLWICRQLASIFNGKIGVESLGEGKGATFNFEFVANRATKEQIEESKEKRSEMRLELNKTPLSSPALAKRVLEGEGEAREGWEEKGKEKSLARVIAEKKGQETKKSSFEEFHALVVDDVKSNRLLVGRVLTRLGMSVDLADDGDTAIEAVLKKKPDILFMDNTMPRMTGIVATKKIRDLGYTFPIIGVTGNSLDEDCNEFMEAGTTAVFVKPVTPKVISKICQENLFP
ncbi:hypothetical protein TrVE_jg1352 [Triparma verrucosa]|uniref:histidine kinase n=1 Tax=Triparma verrucosa TaxID=1606542 RepID=A0A9W7KUX6_9STRA|nr:hypothetical protein TrVE_jg1352 [Triparma verrucosa]